MPVNPQATVMDGLCWWIPDLDPLRITDPEPLERSFWFVSTLILFSKWSCFSWFNFVFRTVKSILCPWGICGVLITVRRSALHGLCDSNSVRPSVCLSVTLVDCVHMVRPTIMISSPYGSPIFLVSRDIKFIPKFEGDHPERGRWMRVGWVRIGDFRPISRRISLTLRDTTKVTINH